MSAFFTVLSHRLERSQIHTRDSINNYRMNECPTSPHHAVNYLQPGPKLYIFLSSFTESTWCISHKKGVNDDDQCVYILIK